MTPNELNWQAFHLTTGWYLSVLVDSVLGLAADESQRAAISAVQALFKSECQDEQQWLSAEIALGELISRHPMRHRESGTWHDGAADLLAMAAAMEACTCIRFKLYPSLHTRYEVNARAYKCMKYVLRAFTYVDDIENVRHCLRWIERELQLPPVATPPRIVAVQCSAQWTGAVEEQIFLIVPAGMNLQREREVWEAGTSAGSTSSFADFLISRGAVKQDVEIVDIGL